MKLLLDECLPLDLRHHIVGHDLFTVRYMKWSGLLNGELLERAASEGFDAFITSDRAIEREQNRTDLPLSVIFLHAKSNSLTNLLPLVPELLKRLNHLPPRVFVHVHAP